MKGVQLTKLVQELGLHNLTPEIDLSFLLYHITIYNFNYKKRESLGNM